MSHNINEQRMFYCGDTPWHGIGTKLNHPATAKEAIESAKLDFQIQMKTIIVKGTNNEITKKKAIVRADNNDVLGIVSPLYKIVQNTDAFNFFDSVIGEKQAVYHTAGALGKGEKIWILAKLPDDIILANNENVAKYLCLVNSHDGSCCLRLYFTPIRVVCQNTLTISLSTKEDGIAIRHYGDVKSKTEEARKILGISKQFYDNFDSIAKELVKFKLNKQQVETYFDNLLDIKNNKDDSVRIKNVKSDLLALFENGKGNSNPEIKHSAWTAYNAVTEYIDWFRKPKGISKDPTNRLKNIWFGTGAQMKNKAFNHIQSLIKI